MSEFDAPIAGMSLTSELGGRPWQKPAKNNEVEDAINEFVPQLTNERFIEELLDVLESGVPIMSIANSMQIGGVMKGLHTIDVGILMLPVLVELLSYIADEAGIEYELGTKKKVDSDEISPAKIAALLAKHNKKSKTPDVEEDMGVEEIMEDTVDEPTGLMARR
tara:strand:+ start:241 stop:732 length:492 start_codon:yes stop_codon:yes gene_type:complete